MKIYPTNNPDVKAIWIATYASYSAQLQLWYQQNGLAPLNQACSEHIALCASQAANEAVKHF